MLAPMSSTAAAARPGSSRVATEAMSVERSTTSRSTQERKTVAPAIQPMSTAACHGVRSAATLPATTAAPAATTMRRGVSGAAATVGAYGRGRRHRWTGNSRPMADPRLEDHAVGVELQLTELNEALERARVQGRTERISVIEGEISALQDDLAWTAERIVNEHHGSPAIHADHAG